MADTGLDKLENRRDYLVFYNQRDRLETAATTESNSPLVVFLLFVVYEYFLNRFKKKLDQMVFALLDIALNWLSTVKPFVFFLSQGCPNFDCLGTYFVKVGLCERSCHLGDCFVIRANEFVVVFRDLDKYLEDDFLDLLLGRGACLEQFLHYEVPLLGDFEVPFGEHHPGVESLEGDQSNFPLFRLLVDVIDQSEHYTVLLILGELIILHFFTDVAKCLERRESDVQIIVGCSGGHDAN